MHLFSNGPILISSHLHAAHQNIYITCHRNHFYHYWNHKEYSELLGSWILSILQYSKKHQRTWRFRNWICFHPQVGERRYLLCWVCLKELASITVQGISPLPHEHGTNPVSEMLCSLMFFLISQTVGKVKKNSIPSDIHHRQNPLESTHVEYIHLFWELLHLIQT
jgi:hypothetical protein